MKSLQRVPIPMTTSASRARALAAVVPVEPIAPISWGWPCGSEPLAGLRLPDRDAGGLTEGLEAASAPE